MAGKTFADAFADPRLGTNAVLERIEALVEWSALAALAGELRLGGTGRPPYAPLSMLKARSHLFGQITNILSARDMSVRKGHVFLRWRTIPNASCTHWCVNQMGRISRFPGKRRWITSKIGFVPF